MDQGWGRGRKCGLADAVPQAAEIVEVTLDFGLGPRKSRSAHNAAHTSRELHIGHDRLQALAVGKA